MKLHDNSRFQGGLVVPWAASKFLKAQGQVQVSGGFIRLTDLQKNSTEKPYNKRAEQVTRDAVPAEFRSYGKIENFALTCDQGSRCQEAYDPIFALRGILTKRGMFANGDQEVIVQIIGGIPAGRLRAGILDGRDLRQVVCIARPDYWHSEYIMHALLPLLFFLAQPFWEAKPPERWTEGEIETIRHDSPWAQVAGPEPAVMVYLATAAPIEMAEEELRLRMKKNSSRMPEPDPDYSDYLRENRQNEFVLAIAYPTLKGLGKAEESKQMEEQSVMVIGRKTYHFTGHFPPTPSDPVLRLIFNREVKGTDKAVSFRLYLPGLNFPEREVEFRVKDLMFQGKLEM